MSFDERGNWVFGVVTLCSTAAYFGWLLMHAPGSPVAEVQYQVPMLVAIGGSIIAGILGTIPLALIWREDCDKRDQRDKEIGRFGNHVGNSLVVVGAAAALFMAMAAVDHFWIANMIYACCAAGGILGSITKGLAYRGAFQRW
jgi:hypothetical protein